MYDKMNRKENYYQVGGYGIRPYRQRNRRNT